MEDDIFAYKPNASYPLNIQNAGGYFSANQQIDFKLNCKGKKIVKNSFALNGTLKIVDANGNTPQVNTNVWLSPSAGLHGLIGNLITMTEKGGVVESILNYGRFSAMKSFSNTSETMQGEVSKAIHGIFPNNNTVLAQKFARGEYGNGNINFSLPLNFCLNNAYNVDTGEQADIPYSLLGSDASPLGITIRLSPEQQCIFGASASNYSIRLYNLMIVWDEIPDDGHNEKIAVKVLNFTRNTVNAQYYSINSFLAQPSTGFMLSFIKQTDEADQTKDFYQIQALARNPVTKVGLTSLELLLDDKNSIFKYRLSTSDQERLYSNMVMQGVDTTSLTRSDYYESNNIGDLYSLYFPTLITGHKVSIILYNPNITSVNGYNAYCYYLGIVEL